MIKAYMIYLNDTKELYAITDDKTKYKSFVAQRNKQLFHIKKVKMTSDEFDNLVYKNKQLLLNDSFLDDGETRMKIVDTIYEEDTLSMVCEVIYNRITRIQKMFENTHLDEKYLKFLFGQFSVIIFFAVPCGKDYHIRRNRWSFIVTRLIPLQKLFFGQSVFISQFHFITC